MAQYIDKDALVAEIERFSAYLDSLHEQRIVEKLLSIIDTLEVKDVDLTKETSNFIDTYYKDAKAGHKLSIRRTAKYFFELGLKAQKGE